MGIKTLTIGFIFTIVIIIFSGGYNAGYNVSDNKFKDYQIKQLELSKIQQEQYNKVYQEKLSLIKELDLANVRNKEQIDNAKLAADTSLADRLQREKIRAVKCPMSKNTGAASRSNDTGDSEGTVVFSKPVATRLGQRQAYADQITESLTVCRNYIKFIGK